MSHKEIIGFEKKGINDDDICPNCGLRTFGFPIKCEETTGFLGIKYTSYLIYTCDRCGCKWKTTND